MTLVITIFLGPNFCFSFFHDSFGCFYAVDVARIKDGGNLLILGKTMIYVPGN